MDAGSGNAPRRLGFSGLSFGAGVVLTVLALFLFSHRPGAGMHAITGQVAGADVTQHGGTKIAILNEGGSITQACNGVCDDLAFVQDSPDNVYRLEVRDPTGRCLLCEKGDYVTNGVEAGWRVDGKDRLTLRRTSRPAYGE
ncbi:hypothetical protein [Phenylobacterium sp.]|uniref:hypothetical protein n=1 Tax=Phenylobacterium sp. TaxID=1871053 RepID=UPI0030F49B9B